MDIQALRVQQLIILECISGSKAYGLDTPQSDMDIKGAFIASKAWFYGLNQISQLNNPSNDITFYELKRLMDLLLSNNPTVLELLFTPKESILFQHPVMEMLQPEQFLSKRCEKTFAGYAITQIKKAKGLQKKILNPVAKERKSLLDFCHVWQGKGSMPLQSWLQIQNIKQEDCGLSSIPHMKDLYAIYISKAGNYKGIFSGETANDVSLSAIDKTAEPAAVMSFNKNGYSTYCRDYREYWNWVKNRNEARYQNTLQHGKNYDAKNMMHTFRLLNMALEIGEQRTIHVKRADRDFLLEIKSGKFQYDELVKMAEGKLQEIESIYRNCYLPEAPDSEKGNELLIKMRMAFYESKA